MHANKPMSDVELMALTVLVQNEVAEMQAANMQRAQQGLSMAYEDFATDASTTLQQERARRGVL